MPIKNIRPEKDVKKREAAEMQDKSAQLMVRENHTKNAKEN